MTQRGNAHTVMDPQELTGTRRKPVASPTLDMDIRRTIHNAYHAHFRTLAVSNAELAAS